MPKVFSLVKLQADAITLEFEEKLRDWLLAYGESELQPKGYNLYVTVARGYVDVAKESITADIWLLPVGFLVVTTYGILMLGHLTCVENRALLCCVGISIIGITILVTYGLCSAFGLFYGPMHNAFPFLILGIGESTFIKNLLTRLFNFGIVMVKKVFRILFEHWKFF